MKYKLLTAMAEDREAVKRALTPPSSVDSGTAEVVENGYVGNSSDESEEENSNCDEAPLDFSVRKRSGSFDEFGGSDSRGSESGSHNATESPPEQPVNLSNSSTIGSRNRSVQLSPSQAEVNGVKPEDLVGKIGEPQLALPLGVPGLAALKGFPPGFNVASAAGILPNAAAGLLGGLPFNPAMIDNRKGQQNNSKPTRPFKAYPKDPLSLPLGYYGIPGMLPGITVPNLDPATAQAMSASTEELFNQYKQLMSEEKNGKGTGSKGQRNNGAVVHGNSPDNSEWKDNGGSPASPMSSSSGSPQQQSTSPTAKSSGSGKPPYAPTPGSPLQPGPAAAPPPGPFISPSLQQTAGAPVKTPLTSHAPAPRKKPKMLPDDKKDSAYWERRRKNNDAAKRSRDARRAKEDEIAIRAAFLEQENLKLRVEVAALKNETAKLRCMLYNS